MVKISNQQMEVFQKELRKPRKQELQAELAEMFLNLPADELNEFIDLGLKKTEKYGIDEDPPVTNFIRLMIVVSRDFDEYPLAQAQLKRKDVNPNLSVQLMCELLTPAEWQEAAEFSPRASDRKKDEYVQTEVSDSLLK